MRGQVTFHTPWRHRHADTQTHTRVELREREREGERKIARATAHLTAQHSYLGPIALASRLVLTQYCGASRPRTSTSPMTRTSGRTTARYPGYLAHIRFAKTRHQQACLAHGCSKVSADDQNSWADIWSRADSAASGADACGAAKCDG
eukprot:578935-Rhodomonas_salina.1